MHGGFFFGCFVFLFLFLFIYLVGLDRNGWYGGVWYGMGKCIAGFVVFILSIYQRFV